MVYEEFCVNKWQEDPDRPLVMLAEAVKLDRLSLGLLAANTMHETDRDYYTLHPAHDETALYEQALRAASKPLRKELFTCLCKAYGDENKLYARLCITSVGLDPTDDECAEDPFEFTPGNLDAYNSFVSNRFRY
jgi:hypothetical protein